MLCREMKWDRETLDRQPTWWVEWCLSCLNEEAKARKALGEVK